MAPTVVHAVVVYGYDPTTDAYRPLEVNPVRPMHTCAWCGTTSRMDFRGRCVECGAPVSKDVKQCRSVK